ncbi:MAG: hypothetical protein L6437_07330 [Kiritimatiellae bacterium]|nr:hypothetical protein [Verrucomicrobiota bacterium]MBU4285906.1 hypothetical protein [Verrucomicrobiota bacterium]MBU4366262.1 hypothetical protein [Verrucomicrobiota bacterium]MCG2660040.1 hypothetical protein [Kiritimatiellia bacterium]
MNMKAMFLSSIVFVLAVCSAQAQVIDPIRDYADRYGLQDQSEIIRLDADINGNGEDEIFLSREGLVNGKAGNIWIVYVTAHGGYEKLDKPITFRRDAFVVDQHPALGRKALLTYRPSGGGKAKLVALRLENNKVKEEVCEEVEQEGEQSDFVQRTLSAKLRADDIKTVRATRTPSK